jgi:ferredoxin
MDEAIRDGNGKPLTIRFGGNLATALEMKTGCLMCLDSCPVGITSNATYTYGAIETRKEAALTGNKDVLPPDGTLVVVTFKAKK